MTSPILAALGLVLAFGTSAFAAPSSSLVRGGDFSNGKAGFWSTDNVRLAVRSGQLCGDVSAGVEKPWDALIGVDTGELKAGQSYVLGFEARATGNDAPDRIKVMLQDPKAPWAERFAAPVEVTEALEPASLPFSNARAGRAQLVFQLGGQQGAWRFCIDNVKLSPAGENQAETRMNQNRAAPVLEPVADPVRLNQAGFLPGGPKRATIISLSKTPLRFQIVDGAGKLFGEGETEVRGVDPASGYSLHVADFTPLTRPGGDYRLVAGEAAGPAFAIDSDLYRRLSVDALSWFYPQRSGIVIDGAIAGAAYARPAGHVGVDPNRGDGAVACLTGPVAAELYGKDWQCKGTRDVSGGWYDAGDHGKYVVNGGISVAQMMAAFERAKRFAPKSPLLSDGFARLPERGNGVPDGLDEARWELEFLLKMIVPDGEPLSGMAYHKVHDIGWTGLPMLPHLDPKERALHRPSTAATLNVAAVAAQGARLFRPYDAAFADRLLAAARTAYGAAQKHPDLFAPVSDGQQGGGDYDDDDVSDEFYWAAAELLITTGDTAYLEALRVSPHWKRDPFDGAGFDWRNVAGFARLELALYGDPLPDADRQMARASVISAADRFVSYQKKQGFGYIYRPKGGIFAWGSNHLMLQNLLVTAAAFDLTGEKHYLAAAREAMDYLLGRNPMNISYITGYGTTFAHNQHSRWYAHQLDPALPSPPAGSLAGGPNATLADPVALEKLAGCAGSRCYIDDIGAWGVNEITINWNAALLQAASFLADAQ